MKKILLILLSLFLLSSCTDTHVYGSKPETKGDLELSNELYWGLNNNVLYLSSKKSENANNITNDVLYSKKEKDIPWNDAYGSFDNISSMIKKVIIENNEIKIKPESMNYWFSGLYFCEEIIGLENIDTSNVESMEGTFSIIQCPIYLKTFNTSNVTNMSKMFEGVNVDTLDISSFDTSKVENMSGMFSGVFGNYLNLSSFNTSKVTNMSRMFEGASLKKIDLTNFNTSKVLDMSCMFNECNIEELDLSSFNTSNVSNMNWMFGKSFFKKINISSFNTSNVEDMSNMFFCTSLDELNLSNFITSNVKNMQGMFTGMNNLIELDLSNFDTSNVENFTQMFYSCDNLEYLDISSFNTSNGEYMKYMFGDPNDYVRNMDISNISIEKATDVSSIDDLFLTYDYFGQ